MSGEKQTTVLTKLCQNELDCHDLSAREAAEEALRKERDFVAAILDTTSTLVLVLDREGGIVRFNRACERLTGYSFAEVKDKRCWDLFVPPEERGLVMAVFAQLTTGSFPKECENHWMTRDGDPRLIAWSNTALLDDEGSVEYVVATGADITERRRAAEECRRSASRAEALATVSKLLVEANLDINTALKAIVKQTAELLGDLCTISLLSDDGHHLEMVAVHHCKTTLQEPLCQLTSVPRCRWQDLPQNEALLEGRPLLVSSLPAEELRAWLPELQFYQHAKNRASYDLVAVPLRVRGDIIGAMTVVRETATGSFSFEDQIFLQGVADRTAMALHNSRTVESLERSEERFRSVVETASDGIVCTDSAGTIVFWNHGAEKIFGYSAAEVIGKTLASVIVLEQLPQANREGLEWCDSMGKPTALGGTIEFEGRRKSGERLPLELSLASWRTREGTFFTTIIRDATERKWREKQLAYLATHDPLTDLPNRKSLEDALNSMAIAPRNKRIGALLFLDVDNFKLVNDTLGHAAGDQLLVTLARVLEENLREGDMLARVGGDEFAVLLRDTGAEEAKAVAERLRQAVLESSFTLDGFTFDLSLSIGLAIPDAPSPPGLLLSDGDAAMYRAKELGGNRVVVCDGVKDGRIRLFEANRLATMLKDALRDGRFVLHFQPVVRLADGSVAYYETLVRLRLESGEIIPASKFVPAAERIGLMPKLTRWIIRQAVQTLDAHAQLRLSVNLSGLDLSDDALPDFIHACLTEYGVDPFRLGFEITETALIRNLVQAERWIRRVRSLGCSFALDDFGSGFVSFAYLRSLTVDQIKIDGLLIRSMEGDLAQRAFVRAVHLLARTLGKETVAEFVENERVVRILRQIGITYAQGYHLGAPGPELPKAPSGLSGHSPALCGRTRVKTDPG